MLVGRYVRSRVNRTCCLETLPTMGMRKGRRDFDHGRDPISRYEGPQRPKRAFYCLTEPRCLRLQHGSTRQARAKTFPLALQRCERITAAKRCTLQPGKFLGLVTTNGMTIGIGCRLNCCIQIICRRSLDAHDLVTAPQFGHWNLVGSLKPRLYHRHRPIVHVMDVRSTISAT